MVFLCGVGSVFTTGCAGKPVSYLSPTFYSKASPRVAVLLFENESVDMLAPGALQKMVTGGLVRHGYQPIPSDMVQQKLKEVGITDGGQLPSIPSKKLGDVLKVDGLFYGTVEDFIFQNLGFVLRRCVRVRLKLVLASTGETLWEHEGFSQHIKATLDKKEAERLFAIGMGQKAIGNMTQHPLILESEIAVRNLLANLPSPGGPLPPGYPPVPPSQSPPGMPPPSPPDVPPSIQAH